MIDHAARRVRAQISAGILATSGLRNSRIVRDNCWRGSLLRRVCTACCVGVLLPLIAPPTPLSGQFGEERAFNYFTSCAPIRITGQHHDTRLLEEAQVSGDITSDLPADVKHILRSKLDEHALATEDVFAWGLSGDLEEATVLPRMEVSVLTQPSGRREMAQRPYLG